MAEVGQRPLPVADDTSAPFWDAAARHVLSLARCSRCQQLVHPPLSGCPHCGSAMPDFQFTPVSGAGAVKSWTVIRQSFLPGFEVPYVLVDVELDVQEDLRLIGRLLDGETPALKLGSRVRLAFEDLATDVAVPAFALDVT